MRVKDVRVAPGMGGFFHDDQLAIREGRPRDGFVYGGSPKTPGFHAVREPAEALLIMIVLEDGQIALGDCCSVQYAGVGGRDHASRGDDLVARFGPLLREELVGAAVSSFRDPDRRFRDLLLDGKRKLPASVRYGLSQALLDAVAKARRVTMADVLRLEYGLGECNDPLRIYAQSGDNWRTNVDKMILKRVDVLPHGLVNDPTHKVGSQGEKLYEMVGCVRDRILELRATKAYRPDLHFDVYGTLGIVFDDDLKAVANYLGRLEQRASPFPLRIEAPVDAGSQSAQIGTMRDLRDLLRERQTSVELVADEWCNDLDDIQRFAEQHAADMIQVKMPDLGEIHATIEALLVCHKHGVKSLLGGSCTETDISTRVSAHIAVACRPYQLLAKPGMGVDEAVMITRNEIARASALGTHRIGA